MTLSEKDIGKFVLIGVTATLALKMLAKLYSVLKAQDLSLLIPVGIGMALVALILWALWSGQKWARYLLGYGNLVGGILSVIITFFSMFDGKGDDLMLIPVYIWYAIIGSLLIWAPGISSYMRELRQK